MVALFAGAKFLQKRALSLFSIATTEKKDRSSVTCVYIFALYLNASIKREEETEKDIKNSHTHTLRGRNSVTINLGRKE